MSPTFDDPPSNAPKRRRARLHVPLPAVVVGLGLASGPAAAAPLPVIARPDSYTLRPDQSSVLTVLHNDTFPNGSPVVFQSLTKPEHGNVFVQQGTLVYTPFAGFTGSDAFRYCIGAPGVGNSCAVVSLLVLEPPVPVPALATLALAGLSGVLGFLGVRGRRRS
jgi:hypothetical protein